MVYNWQLDDWPAFSFDISAIEGELLALANLAGQVNGMLKALPEGIQMDALVDIMIVEAIKTSEIEGEFLSRPDGFKGGMNARKYVALTRISKATATRDLQSLVELGVFAPVGGGRRRCYRLNL